ncbi:MAG: hypothetical protein J7K54_04190 [Candidatus Aenigmarchaeota archaeon]|nr:hypothetical protein [Candidatus Aenigmarchaeota archaeon]
MLRDIFYLRNGGERNPYRGLPDNIGKWLEYYKSRGIEMQYRIEKVPLDERMISLFDGLDGERVYSLFHDVLNDAASGPLIVEEWCPGRRRPGVVYPTPSKTIRFVLEEEDHYAARAMMEMGKNEADAVVLFSPQGEHWSYGTEVAKYGKVRRISQTPPFRRVTVSRREMMPLKDVPLKSYRK